MAARSTELGRSETSQRGGAPGRLCGDPRPVRVLAEQVAAVRVHAVREVGEVGGAPAAEAHRIDLDRGDAAGPVDAQLDVDGEVGEAGAPPDLIEELHRRRAQARDRLGAGEVHAVAHVVGRDEQVRVEVDDHRSAVSIEVCVDGELLAVDDFLDHEPVEPQHLVGIDRGESLDLMLDLCHHCRPHRRRLDHVDAQAEEAHSGFDDEGRAQARGVEGAQCGERQTEVTVVRVQVGYKVAERDLVFEQVDPARQVRLRKVFGDPADGVL